MVTERKLRDGEFLHHNQWEKTLLSTIANEEKTLLSIMTNERKHFSQSWPMRDNTSLNHGQ